MGCVLTGESIGETWVAYCKDKNATKQSGHNDEEAAAEHDKENILLLVRKSGFPYQLQRRCQVSHFVHLSSVCGKH